MNRVHAVGKLKVAKYRGKNVYFKDKLFVKEWGRFVPVAPDDDHFIFENKTPQEPSYMCTCGSPAVVTGFQAYTQYGSPIGDGTLFTCQQFLNTGKHFPINKERLGK